MKNIVIFMTCAVIAAGIIIAVNYSAPDPVERLLIGGDKDANGCLVGAGYSWCEAKGKCIRTWEEYCTATSPKTAIFSCTDGKSIKATFYAGDDKYVDLDLGQDYKISLPRAMSGSGARYAKPDESLVFWNKGDTATIQENGIVTHDQCSI